MAEAENGYEAWLRYGGSHPNLAFLGSFQWALQLEGRSPVSLRAREELERGFRGLLSIAISRSPAPVGHARLNLRLAKGPEAEALGREGFSIEFHTPGRGRDAPAIEIAAGSEAALVWGAFSLLRRIETGELKEGRVGERPRAALRLLEHWDNPDGSVERGYAGGSIFFRGGRIMPVSERTRDYARLVASVGLNGVVLNNPNVGPPGAELLSAPRLEELASLARLLSEWGIRVYLSVSFASPILCGSCGSADPEDPAVRAFWADKAEEIYSWVPNFGGFLVKADSEGQPGPATYHKNAAQGANVIAEALEPFGGVVLWRSFAYGYPYDWRDRKRDRARDAYDIFAPLDGQFAANVILQVKYGPLDFQVREPVSPLLGAMPRTQQMLEVQLTQEYTGQQRHVCYLVPLWRYVLDWDTYWNGEGSTVAKVVDGSLWGWEKSGMAGVANVGDSFCWTGHPLAAANLYGFGRLAWDASLSAEKIADEWIALSFGRDPMVQETVRGILLRSWPAFEAYSAPLGVGFMVKPGTHYGADPDGYEYSPWGTYHYADHQGVGVDRTSKGTGMVEQYAEPLRSILSDPATCPEELLLFFHHLSYDYRLRSGKSLIQHIYDSRFWGAEEVRQFLAAWEALEGRVDPVRFRVVRRLLKRQAEEAAEWRDVVSAYFFRKSGHRDEHGRQLF
jgi:alpha-glucuronidase